MTLHALAIKSEDDTTLVLEGWGVVFTGPESTDLTGDYFTKSTDFWLDRLGGAARPVLYNHGFDAELKRSVIGTGSLEAKATPDVEGLWFTAQLDKSTAYVKQIRALAEAGLLGASTGAISHLVEREAKSTDASWLKTWPIGEVSLTVTPAEPRTIGIAEVRSLVEFSDGLKAVLDAAEHDALPDSEVAEAANGIADSEAAEAAAPKSIDAASVDPAEVKATEPTPADAATKAAELSTEETQMSQEILDAIQAVADQQSALNTRIDGIETAVKSTEPEVKTGGVAVPNIIVRPSADSDAEAEFKSFLRGLPVKAAMNETTNSQGGYAVPAQYSNDLVKPLTDLSYLRMAGARIITVTGTDAFHVPALTFASAATLTAEAAGYTEAEPTMAETLFAPWKLTRLSKVSEELAADSRFDLWGQILQPDFAQSFAAAENTYFTTGTGSSQPAGVVTGATGSVFTEATGNTTTVTADGIISTYFTLDYKYRSNAVWMMNDATLQLVRKLKDSQNRYLFELNPFAGGNPLQTAQGPNGVATSGYLLGKPVITNNAMATATANAVTALFGDFSYYWIADFGGVDMQRLSELYAANGQIGFRAFRRVDGHLMLTAAIAAHKQSAT